MNYYQLTDFFMWCTIFNAILLFISFFVCILAKPFIYRMHGHWFPMSEERFNQSLYLFLGCYKVIIIVFNLVPFIVLLTLKQ